MSSLTFGDDASDELNMEQLLNEPTNDNEREHLEPMLNDEEAELEEDVPALRNRVVGLVVDPLHANDTNRHTEHHVKCVCDALHELEGGAREFRTLGFTEDAHALLYTPGNAQSESAHKRHVNHCKAHVESDENRTCDENNIVNYFAHCYVAGNHDAGAFWCTHSCINSYLLTSMKMNISEHKLLRKLTMPTTKKHVAEKGGMLHSDEYQAAIEETLTKKTPKNQQTKLFLSHCDMARTDTQRCCR